MKIVDPLAQVCRARQVSRGMPPLVCAGKPVGEVEVGVDLPAGIVCEGNEGSDAAACATSNSKRQLVSERLNLHSRGINRFVE